MRLSLVAAASIAALSITACGDDPSPVLAPQYQPEITNLTDSFSFQLTGVMNGSGTLSYSWQNTGTLASIDRSSSIGGGTVTLTLRDAANAQVYQGPLNGTTGSVTTGPAGAAGTWTIVVDFVDTTGTINFRAQKQ